MGIDIYARWPKQTEAEKEAQYTGFSTISGDVGYLREAYHGGPYVTRFLLQEGFDGESSTVKIPASVLRERLPAAVAIAIHRNTKLYGRDNDPISVTFEGLQDKLKNVFAVEMKDDSAKEIAKTIDADTIAHINNMIEGKLLPDYAQAFVDFVELCERKEAEAGEPCEIHVSA